MRDLSSLTEKATAPPAVQACSLNHWTAREVPRQIDLEHLLQIITSKRISECY